MALYSLNLFLNSQAEDATTRGDGAPREGMKKISYQWYKLAGIWLPEPEPVTLSKSRDTLQIGFGDALSEIDASIPPTFKLVFADGKCPFSDSVRDGMADGTLPPAYLGPHVFLGLQGTPESWLYANTTLVLENTGQGFAFSVEVDAAQSAGTISYWVDPRMNVDT